MRLCHKQKLKRFNPACAGNSQALGPLGSISSVQPRLRGELSSSWPFRFNFIGSTPLARGTPVSRCTALTVLRFNPACAGNSCRNNQVPVKDVRFNPACAGNSQTEYLISHWSPVQPRLRGELRATGINIGKPNGSTPLARGTPIPFLLKAICLRFNPACAGNSLEFE